MVTLALPKLHASNAIKAIKARYRPARNAARHGFRSPPPIWKTLWLAIVASPQWWAGQIDESIKGSIFACSLVVLAYIAIPWGFSL
jgi:hypothetical protein